MTRSTFLLTMALVLAAAMPARAQQSTSPTTPALLPPPLISAPGAAKVDPCAEQQRAEEEESAAFQRGLQEHERRQAAHKAATTNRVNAQAALDACRQTVDSGPGRTGPNAKAFCARDEQGLADAIKAEAAAATLASTPISATYASKDQAVAALEACRQREATAAVKKAVEGGRAAAQARAAIGVAKDAVTDSKRQRLIDDAARWLSERARAEEEANERYLRERRTPGIEDLPFDITDLPEPPTAPTNVPQRPEPQRPEPQTNVTNVPQRPDRTATAPDPALPDPSRQTGGTSVAAPPPPPPLPPAPPKPPGWTMTPDGGMTCNYRDGGSSWSFTTWDKEIIASGCPVIPPGYNPIRPPATASGTSSAGGASGSGPGVPPSSGSGGTGSAAGGTGTASSSPGSSPSGVGPSGPRAPFGLRPDTGVAGAPLPPAIAMLPPTTVKQPDSKTQPASTPPAKAGAPSGPERNQLVTQVCAPTGNPAFPIECVTREFVPFCVQGTKGSACPPWEAASSTMLCEKQVVGKELNQATCKPAKCEIKLRNASDPNSRYTDCQVLTPQTQTAAPSVLPPKPVAVLPPKTVAPPPAPKPAPPIDMASPCAGGGYVHLSCRQGDKTRTVCSRKQDLDWQIKGVQQPGWTCTADGKPVDPKTVAHRPWGEQKDAVSPETVPVLGLPQLVQPPKHAPVAVLPPAPVHIPAPPPAPPPVVHTPAPPPAVAALPPPVVDTPAPQPAPPPVVHTPAPPPVLATPSPAEAPVEEAAEDDPEDEEDEDQSGMEEDEQQPSTPQHTPRIAPAMPGRTPRIAPAMPHQPSAAAPPVYVPQSPLIVPHIPSVSPHVAPRIGHRPPHHQPHITHRPPVYQPRIAVRPPVHRPTVHINRVAPRAVVPRVGVPRVAAPRVAAPRIQVHRPPVYRPPPQRPLVFRLPQMRRSR